VFTRLRNSPLFNTSLHTIPTDFSRAEGSVTRLLREFPLIDLAFCPFDRLEMLGAALAFWRNRIPVAQIHAGDYSTAGCFDDMARHMITLASDLQLCVGEKSYQRAKAMMELVGKPTDRCFQIRSIHMDDAELNLSHVPREPFDLVVYNPPTKRLDLILDELTTIDGLLGERLAVWVEPNEDEGRTLVLEEMHRIAKSKRLWIQKSVPRPQFLGLLSKCTRALGNSSAFFFELTHFGKTHIHVGVRNSGRQSADSTSGGSDQILSIVEDLYGV